MSQTGPSRHGDHGDDGDDHGGDPGGGGPQDRPHPVFARLYARASARMDAEGLADLRAELVRGLAGTVVEVGAGNGRMFAHYPPGVTRVQAVEPEPSLRALATAAAASAPVPVTVRPGTAERLPLPDRSADAAVLCLVLCSVADPRAAVAEVVRVLRPGGTVRFLEHAVAPTRGLRVVQRTLDATVWPLLTGGCHTSRDPVGTLTAAGVAVTDLRALRYPVTQVPTPVTHHVLGSARTPGGAP
ncbi:class I SAM-dependent methyltransferase [Cellulomonas aerilata]|uniref:Methyltransferase type 11 n=1 Tax=Cellulomonas aerilata TaxID=515326 RepID=A0A512D813_9CELL|nr:class I SAM-dependent methyltransferase [Cellulomonas aerilata]GEO32420.1 methyltransferase type 11 [Cellulomonas aerilata]